MEYFLGKLSKKFDKNITDLNNLNYNSWSCKIYERSTVLIGDILFFFAIKKFCSALNFSRKNFLILLGLLESFYGLVIIDNMHFQYNTILFSVFIYSIAFISNEQYILGAIFFSIASCMKHIFGYMAIAFVVFYLQFYVFYKNPNTKRDYRINIVLCLIKLGIAVIGIILLSFSPFIFICIKEKNLNQLIQIKNRLFPFQRGLLHTYWAPNFWALYSFMDKILFYLKKSKINLNDNKRKNTSALGITQVTEFDVLPNISSLVSNLCLIVLLAFYFTKDLFFNLYEKPSNNSIFENKFKFFKAKKIIQYCLISNLIFFNFGYHVHEKAFLIISILTIFYILVDKKEKEYIKSISEKEINNHMSKDNNIIGLSQFMIILGSIAQIPLIHEHQDYFPKIIFLIFYILLLKYSLGFNLKLNWKNIILYLYIYLSLLLDLNTTFSQNLSLKKESKSNKIIYLFDMIKNINISKPFLSLMIYSVISSLITQIILIALIFI